MDEQKTYKLTLKGKIFTIPSNFKFFYDVNPTIYSSLMTKKEYNVLSDVDETVFQSFINQWINNETPYFNADNISQFQLLSEEFDRIQDLIQIFQKKSIKFSFYSNKNKEMKDKLQQRMDYYNRIKTKYQEVNDFLIQKDNINFNSIFKENIEFLIDACIIGDMNYIDIFTRKKCQQDGLVYILNKNDKTAGLLSDKSGKNKIFIPTSIFYENQEYLITKIVDSSFLNSKKIESIEFSDDSKLNIIGKYSFSDSNLKSILIPSTVTKIEENAFSSCRMLKRVEFKPNSQIKVIEKYAFAGSFINELFIPSNIEEIQEGCFSRMSKLNIIKIIENKEKNIDYYNDSFIIGKSSKEQENFDVLILSRKNIEIAKIPSFIKKINSNAFQQCMKLKQIEFSPNSELISIGEFAFASSSISQILIPSSVKIIKSNAFRHCMKLKKIDFQENSELEIIENNAFASCSIEHISIPSSVNEIQEGCFESTNELNDIQIIKCKNENFIYYDNSFILGKSSKEEQNFDVLILSRRDIEVVKIPSFIKIINAYAFYHCKKIQRIEFSPNSNLYSIGKNAFASTSIETILFPSSVVKLCEFSFSNTENLKNVEFLKDSNLCSIEKYSFLGSSIESITIPSSVIEIEDESISNVNKLKSIKVIQCEERNFAVYNDSFIVGKSDLTQENFDRIVIARRNIEKAIIPSFIKYINSFAFYCCSYLKEVEFADDSELISIEKFAFALSPIKEITIPPHVKKIGTNSFTNCTKLSKIDFKENSELKIIDDYAFSGTSIESISIPSSVVVIEKDSFNSITKLNNIKVIPCKEQNILLYDDSFIIKKSSKKQSKFDDLVLAKKNIKIAIIPSFIKNICSFAFAECSELEKINIPQNSKLCFIGDYAFAFSSISSLFIPKYVSFIGDFSFYLLKNNLIVEISENSQLQHIDNIFSHNGDIIMIPYKSKSEI